MSHRRAALDRGTCLCVRALPPRGRRQIPDPPSGLTSFRMPRVTPSGQAFRASATPPRSPRRHARRSDDESPGEAAPHLLAAAPIIAVQEEMERHVSDLRRLGPTSDAATELALYLGRLVKALEDARNLELFIPVEAAAVILGKSPSMVTCL